MEFDKTLVPHVGVVTDVRKDTPDVKTFRVVSTDGKKLFEHIPGQCAMLSVPGVGEAMFSITSSPTNKEFMEFSIKKCGCLTEWLHQMEVGQQVTVRGPYGNGFPVETTLKGKDLLFIAGGIGLAGANMGGNIAHLAGAATGLIVGLSKSRERARKVSGGEAAADLVVTAAKLHGTTFGKDIMPRLIDEIPVIAVAALFAEGDTVITGAGELRVKETDRLQAIADTFSAPAPGSVEAGADSLVIHGGTQLQRAAVPSYDDHRMAMSLAILGAAGAGVIIERPDCVRISYPEFYDTLAGFGGE